MNSFWKLNYPPVVKWIERETSISSLPEASHNCVHHFSDDFLLKQAFSVYYFSASSSRYRVFDLSHDKDNYNKTL